MQFEIIVFFIFWKKRKEKNYSTRSRRECKGTRRRIDVFKLLTDQREKTITIFFDHVLIFIIIFYKRCRRLHTIEMSQLFFFFVKICLWLTGKTRFDDEPVVLYR